MLNFAVGFGYLCSSSCPFKDFDSAAAYDSGFVVLDGCSIDLVRNDQAAIPDFCRAAATKSDSS